MKYKKFVENWQYVVLAGLIIAQCVIGENFMLGQGLYLFCNVVSVIRDYLLHRPLSDKVKDYACTIITIIIIIKYL